MKGVPHSGDSRDSIILAGQPAAPFWGPGSTGVALLCLHSCPAPSLTHPPAAAAAAAAARATLPSIPSTSALVPNAASVLRGCWAGAGEGPGQLRRVGAG